MCEQSDLKKRFLVIYHVQLDNNDNDDDDDNNNNNYYYYPVICRVLSQILKEPKSQRTWQ